MGGGNCHRPEQRREVPVFAGGDFQGTGDADVHARAAIENLLSAAERNVAAAVLELRKRRACRRESVGFMQKTGEGDATGQDGSLRAGKRMV